MITKCLFGATVAVAALMVAAPAARVMASSHMDAPLISFDDPANITDVYAFVSRRPNAPADDYLTIGMSVYPFEEPGIGPNNYRFDPAVDYELHVALGRGAAASGIPDITYAFDFEVEYQTDKTILQTYLGVLTPGGKGAFAANQNLRQTYTVTRIDRGGKRTVLGTGIAPPNNQGRVTPFYNIDGDGDRPALPGATSPSGLDPYTRQAIASLKGGYRVFAGQRDDAFYADIQSIFDLDFTFGADRDTPSKPFDSQAGFNVHTIVLEIPFEELGGAKIAGVYATTSRQIDGKRVQVGRQGNPLFNEVFVAVRDKDRYNATPPTVDKTRFAKYARKPELSALLGATPIIPGLIEAIFIPDLIRVDLTTGPARLAGQDGFNRLGVFGGDTLQSTVQDPFDNGGTIPGGWPNGRRFGDDVLDIGIIALGIAGPGPDFSQVDVDRVSQNDITYNTVFPYAATPQNGRVHSHPAGSLD